MKLITVTCLDNTTFSFIALFVNWYNNRLLPLIRQLFLIPNRINEFMDLDYSASELFKILFWHSPGSTEEKFEKLQVG
jgi:hypothetical protein